MATNRQQSQQVTEKHNVVAIEVRRWLLDNEITPRNFLADCNRNLPRTRWRILRELYGSPLELMAHAWDVDTSTVSRWLNGKRSPSGEHAQLLYEELRWMWEYLLEDQEWTIVQHAWQKAGSPGDFDEWRQAHRDGVLVGVDRG